MRRGGYSPATRIAILAGAGLVAVVLAAAIVFIDHRTVPAPEPPLAGATVAPVPAEPRPAPVPLAPPPPRVADRAGFSAILHATSDRMTARFFAGNDRVLVLDFPTLRRQADALNRVAALVEKEGAPRDRILSEQELTAYLAGRNESYETFYVGHNYTAASLARFFNLAEAQGTRLNEAERALLAVVTEKGLLGRRGQRLEPLAPDKALISIVQAAGAKGGAKGLSIDMALRETILRHELSHGEFATSEPYRAYCLAFWHEVMSEDERAAFRGFLKRNGYDPSNETLMINETQAFLAHTPDARAFSAQMVGLPEAEVAGLQARFWDGLEARGMRQHLAREAR